MFPVFGPTPRQEYTAFAQARDLGVRVLEREGRASVNELVIENPTKLPILLYEGEDVLGAQQDRIFDVAVLVAAGSKLEVPVTCVEARRWDSSRHRDELSPSRHAAYVKLRQSKASSKSRRVHQRLSAFTEARANQSDVWAGVKPKAVYHGSRSSTGAMQVFATLHGPLVQGYALDALEAQASAPPTIEAASGFALLVADSAVARRTPSLGLGEEIRIASNGVAGSALAVDGEVVQLTAFPGGAQPHDRPAERRTRSAPPTRPRQ